MTEFRRVKASGGRDDETPAPDVRCLVCGAVIGQPRTGRPARYCGTPCRQAAHRARSRTTEAASHAAWLCGHLAADLARACDLGAELAAALDTTPATAGPAAGRAGDDGQAVPENEPPTGWEAGLGELASRLSRLATAISGSAREHQAVAVAQEERPTRSRVSRRCSPATHTAACPVWMR